MDINENEMPEWTMKEKDGSELSDFKKTVLKNMWVQTALLKAIAEKININDVYNLEPKLHRKLHEGSKMKVKKAIYDHEYESKNMYDAELYKKSYLYDEEDE